MLDIGQSILYTVHDAQHTRRLITMPEVAEIRVGSTEVFDTPKMLQLARDRYNTRIRKDMRWAVVFVNDLLFRGRDEAAAAKLLDGEYPYTVEDRTVSFLYNGDAYKQVKLNVSITLERGTNITQGEIDHWRVMLHSKVNDLVFGGEELRTEVKVEAE
jgi:hypothetical protein